MYGRGHDLQVTGLHVAGRFDHRPLMRHHIPMKKMIVLYALALAAGAFLLQWLEYTYITRIFSGELYAILIAVLFTALGIWVGNRLTAKKPEAPFAPNDKAIASLGISPREIDVLELLADGQSNKEIARSLSVSPNTVKTHLAKLYEKLEVSRRTQAIARARELRMIP